VAKSELPIHGRIRDALDAPDDMTDEELLKTMADRTKVVCKPCWELKYCPYGPLVEDFPLLPPTREEANEHDAYLRRCLDAGMMGSDLDVPLDDDRRKMFEEDVADFDPEDYPEAIPAVLEQASCSIFGHICPVLFTAESFTETSELRRMGRHIPTAVKMRVARRDNNMCQEPGCGRVLNDFEIEFDHIIPIARGGSSEEHNVRVTCREHNRRKGATYEP
jgi:hypothetical protein